MAKNSVKVVDKGAARVEAGVRDWARIAIDLGVIGNKGGADHRGAAGLTVAQLAEIHEFGLGVPRRSWLRDFIDENERQIEAFITKELDAVIWRGRTKEQAARRLGAWLQGEIQQRIANGIEPANAPATIAKKKSSKPLIDKGQLRQAITHRVVKS